MNEYTLIIPEEIISPQEQRRWAFLELVEFYQMCEYGIVTHGTAKPAGDVSGLLESGRDDGLARGH